MSWSCVPGMFLSLPAGAKLLKLPTEQITSIEGVVRELRHQAITKAAAVPGGGASILAQEWKAVDAIAKAIGRKFKLERQKREKAALTVELMEEMGFKDKPVPLNKYVGMSAFQAPPAEQKCCVVEASQLAFAPWIDFGDLISVDFTATALSYDGLYLVAVGGEAIAIRGFRQPVRNSWLEYESMEKPPTPLQLTGKLMPRDYEIVGRIVDVFKKAEATK